MSIPPLYDVWDDPKKIKQESESKPRHPQEQPIYAGWYVSLAAGIDFMARRGHEGSIVLLGNQLETSQPADALSKAFIDSIQNSFGHSLTSFRSTLRCTVKSLEGLSDHYQVWHPEYPFFPGRPATVIRSKLIKIADIGSGS